MGWTALAADAPLDSAQPPAQQPTAVPSTQASQTAPAAPVAAPTGFAPLPADAKLDDGTSPQAAPSPPPTMDQTRAVPHPSPTDAPIIVAAIRTHPKAQEVDPSTTVAGFDGEVSPDQKYHSSLSDADKVEYATFFTDPKNPPSAEALRLWFHQKTGAYMGNADDIVKSFAKSGKFSTNQSFVTPTVAQSGPAAFVNHTANSIAKDYGPEVGGAIDALGLGGHGRPSIWNSDTSLGNTFANDADLERAQLERDSADHPIWSGAGELTGAALTAPVDSAALSAVGLSHLPGVLRAAGEGAAYGSGSAGPGNRTEGAVVGAGAGAAMDVALPYAARLVRRNPDSTNYVQLARELNVRRTPATNSRTGIASVIQSGLGALPGGTPVGQAAERESAGLANAAHGVAEGVGTISDRQGAGTAIAEGAQAYKASSKAEATNLYNQRDAAMGGTNAPVSLDNFSKSVNDLAQQFPNSPALQQLREHPVIRQVTGALGQAANADDGQITLGQATEALSHVRGVLRNLQATNSASPVVISRVAGVEQALENDVMNGAKAADQAMGREPGVPGSAVAAQQQADAFYADRAQALNGSLKRPIQSAADDTRVSGEAVYNQVSGDMEAKSGNLARLRDTWFRLPDEAKSTFAATKIDDLGRAAPGQQNADGSAWSFHSFLTNLNKMSPQARNIVFGSNADSQLQQIATYANRLRQLDRMRNFSNTAQKYFAGAFMATVGHAVVSGDLGGAAEAAMALPATWGGAKLLLSSPAMRDWTAKALRLTSQGNENGLKVLTKNLGALAKNEPAIAPQVLGLQQSIMKAANDNLWPLAASGSQQKPQANGNNPAVAGPK